MERKGKIIALFIANALFVLATIGLIILASTNWGRGKKKDYDMSGVVFADLTVEYDGQPHSILATNLPEGVSVSYDNNDQTEIGTYTVTAHFYGDEERHNPIPDKTATLTVTKPVKSRILSAIGFEIDETGEPPRIYCDVSNATEQIDLSDKITVMPNRTWKLFEDADGNTELTSKTMSLEIGHNIAYIIITDLINNTATYEVDVYRLDMKSYTFKNEGQIHASGEIEEKSQLESPEIPEKPYYTFTGWAVEGSTDIVQFPYTVTKDIIFVAQYKLTEYKITYHLDGGINDEGNPEYYNIETPDIELLPATRDGYIFEGWYSDAQFGTEVTVIEHGSSGEKELYAKWAYGSEGLIYEQIGSEYKVIGYNGNAAEIIVPEEWKGLPVTAIDKGVFANCTNLEKLTIPFIGATKDGKENTHFGYIFGAEKYDENTDFVPTSLKTVIITGGTFIDEYAFWYCVSLTSITLPDSVKRIATYAFNHCENLDSITIPDKVTSISYGTFQSCKGLKSVTFSEQSKLTTIDSHAFWFCESLTNITIPDSVTQIGGCAFGYCESLTNITIPDGVTSIGLGAFVYCTSLTSIIIPDSVTSIGKEAFCVCTSLTSIEIPASVISIGKGAFERCTSLEEITIPFVGATKDGKENTHFGYIFGAGNPQDNVSYVPLSLKTVIITGGTTIDYRAFFGCQRLASIVIPDSVTSIGEEAFSNCFSLTSATVGKSVRSIGVYAFWYCTSLEEITLPFVGGTKSQDTNTHFGYIFGAYRYYENSAYVPSSLKTVILTGGTTIANNAFYGCRDISNITISESIISIGETAFRNCTSLENVTFAGNSNLTHIGLLAFSSCANLKSISIPESVTFIDESAFSGLSNLTAVYITDIVKWCKIGFGNYTSNPLYYAENLYLNGKLVTELEIPDSITAIGNYAFFGYKKLTSIKTGVNSQLNAIGKEAFSGCANLATVIIPDSLTYVSSSAFADCDGLTAVYITDMSSWCNIKFSNANANPLNYTKNLYLNNKLVTQLEIPDSVTSIGSFTFCGYEKLTGINTGTNSKLVSVGAEAFKNCTNLVAVALPGSLTSISDSMFYGCTGLKSIIISEGVTAIGEYAFGYCKSLSNIEIPAKVTSIGSYAFYGCESLKIVTFGEQSELTFIGSSAFANCTSLTNVTFGENSKLTYIGRSAFYWCTSLTGIEIPDSVTEIGDYAFYNCEKLTSVVFKRTSGWTADDTSISSSNLENPATAAKYLKDTYSTKYWKRTEAE